MRGGAHLGCVGDAAGDDVDPEHELAVALLVPTHPIKVLPRRQRRPRLDGLTVVVLDEGAEAVDTERVHEVLEAGRGAHL